MVSLVETMMMADSLQLTACSLDEDEFELVKALNDRRSSDQ